jgi:hypothetical protein
MVFLLIIPTVLPFQNFFMERSKNFHLKKNLWKFPQNCKFPKSLETWQSLSGEGHHKSDLESLSRSTKALPNLDSDSEIPKATGSLFQHLLWGGSMGFTLCFNTNGHSGITESSSVLSHYLKSESKTPLWKPVSDPGGRPFTWRTQLVPLVQVPPKLLPNSHHCWQANEQKDGGDVWLRQ